jgi:hypothetical protein
MNEFSGEAYRKRRADAEAFYEVIKQFETGQEADLEPDRIEQFLDGIALHGINGAAELALDGLEPIDELYQPADDSQVREYLRWLTTTPPLRVKAVGSVDQDFVVQNRLTENFVEEIRAMLQFVDPDTKEITVFEFAHLREKMREVGLESFRKLITVLTLDIHNIWYIVEDQDQAGWNNLKKLAEELSSELCRDYSEHLRNKKKEGSEATPLQDVWGMIEELEHRRQRMIELVQDNTDISPWEKRRLYEKLPPRWRELFDRYFEEYAELEPEELRDPDVHQ